MRIIYDYQAFTLQKYGGVSRCFVELYRNLPKEVDARILVRESDNVYLKDAIEVFPKGYHFSHFICHRNFPGKYRLHLLTDRFRKHKYYPEYNTNYVYEELDKGDFDIFHPTYYSDYFLSHLNGKPFVLTIHDMIPELYPQYYGYENIQIVMKRKLAPLAKAIIAVSENTKQDIIRILGIPEEKIHVVYHGCSLPIVKETSRPFSFPYILFVGARWTYKNFIPFARSLAPILKSHKDLHIVCTGSDFDNEEKTLFEELGVGNRIIHQWVKNDKDLYELYHYALCFVFPSEYEGFGIPILEAYQADCPVLLNRRSCFPEIADDAAIYFDMDAIQNNFAEKLETFLKMNKDDREILLEKQRQRLQHFSWEQSAKQLAQIYYSIL
ncbi:MAG: glycosyltransferase family 4 protein [Prevotella sp.]|nr:glycosyltransferase family 4 protein [Prevotella sp.]